MTRTFVGLHEVSRIANLMEGDQYRQGVDGPPLQPTTIHGAEHQLDQIAQNLEYTFGRDERFAQFKDDIAEAVNYIRKAVSVLGPVEMGELRTARHKFARPDDPGL